MGKSVWYVTKYFSPQTATAFGGRGHSLMKELSKLDFNVTVITSDSNNLCEFPRFDGRQQIEDKFGYRLVLLKTMKYSLAKSFRRILSWFHFEWNLFRFDIRDQVRPDVVIISSLSLLTIFYGLYLKKKLNCKLIFEVRDIWPLTIIEEGGFSKYNPFVLFLSYVEWLAYKKSDHIVGTMPNLIDHVRSVTNTNVPVSCIPMGLDLDADADVDYQGYALPMNGFNVVYAGTIGITNALEPFLEAAKRMKDIKGIHFIIVGNGALRDEYIQKYKSPNLIFIPKVPRNMVQSLLSHADLLYLSVKDSKVWDYGLSLNKLIDYMRSGKPILASYSGFQSMINEANCGRFIPSDDVNAIIDAIYEFKKMPTKERELIGQRGSSWLRENREYSILALDYKSIIDFE